MAVSLGFTEADIKRAAGGKSFERGLDYVGEVEDLDMAGGEITASVRGGSRYRVRLGSGGQGVRAACTCPQGQEGAFCKHCVAVGLAVLEREEDLPRLVEQARAERRALESWLESLSREELLAELRGLLEEDRDLRRRLEVRAASVNADAAAIRRAVRELVTAPRRHDIQAFDYTGNVHEAASAIDELIRGGGAADAIGITREAIGLVAEAAEFVDDPSGYALDGALQELMAVHLRACLAAPPDPVSLGEYLAGLLLDDRHDIGHDLGDYAGLLGDEGTAAVRGCIVAAYKRHPRDWRARLLMESAAKAEGDVDALVALYAADLNDRGGNHLRIARVLDEADRPDEALGWAERGLREAARPDAELVDYLADRYAAAGRDGDVLGLRRDRFRAERTLASYRALRRAAVTCGVWQAEREEALALLREDVHSARSRWNGPVLVDALTDDGDLPAAWAVAGQVPATQAQWLRLADASAASRPADALGVYQRVIEALKKETGDNAYRRMASLLLSARACHEALGTTGQFRRYLALLRMECKRKRNLMRILDSSGL